MENLYGSSNTLKASKIESFDGDVWPINTQNLISSGGFHSPLLNSPVSHQYRSLESPNARNIPSPLVRHLRSSSPVSPSRPGTTLFKTSVEFEEDVVVMDAILVDPKSGSTRAKLTVSSSGSGWRSPSSSTGGENSFHKMDTCLLWIEFGTRRLGSKCQFAHGKEELRPPRFTNSKSSKYKVQICNSYSLGSCAFGTKCRFVHHRLDQIKSAVPSPPEPPPPAMTLPLELETATPIKVECPANGDNNTTTTMDSAVRAHASANWFPQDDGIEIFLPGKAKASTKEDFDAHIETVLYCPDVKRRLPVFVEFCPE